MIPEDRLRMFRGSVSIEGEFSDDPLTRAQEDTTVTAAFIRGYMLVNDYEVSGLSGAYASRRDDILGTFQEIQRARKNGGVC